MDDNSDIEVKSGVSIPPSQLKHAIARLERSNGELKGKLKKTKKALANAPDGIMGEGEEEGWLTVYLDMMTLMLVLLIVMLAFSSQRQERQAEESDSKSFVEQASFNPLDQGLLPNVGDKILEGANPSHSETLDLTGVDMDVEVIMDEDRISFRMSNEILFASGSADLSSDGYEALDSLIPVLNQNIDVLVEGHTDNIAISSYRYPSNWELSGARAASVVRYLEAKGIPSQRLRFVGYGETRPLAENTIERGRYLNRRVDIVIQR